MLNLTKLKVSINNKDLLDIDELTIFEGELFTVLGKNGAGKSTLFNSISGDIACTGQRFFHQKCIKHWPKNILAKHLAVLPQNSQLSFPFSVQEVASLGLIPLDINQRQGRLLVKQTLELTDTLRFSRRPYLSLSGGERQRVHLARVLVQLSQAEQAPLLLLDEPTSAQDLAQQHQLLELTKSLCIQKNYAALVILHDLNLSVRYSDRVGIIESGSFAHVGPPKQLLTPDIIEQQWGYRPQTVKTETGLHALI